MENEPLFNVSDMAKSLEFYRDGMGYRVTNEWRPGGELRWCRVEREGSAIMLQKARKPVSPGSWSLCIICEDAVALYHELLSNHIERSEEHTS